jgi:hypothetical protein
LRETDTDSQGTNPRARNQKLDRNHEFASLEQRQTQRQMKWEMAPTTGNEVSRGLAPQGRLAAEDET